MDMESYLLRSILPVISKIYENKCLMKCIFPLNSLETSMRVPPRPQNPT